MEQDSRENRQIFSEAAEWFVEFREGDVDPQARSRFNRWLRRSPEHIKAYLEVAAFWADVPSFIAKDRIDVQALIAYGREDDNVIPLSPPRLVPLREGEAGAPQAHDPVAAAATDVSRSRRWLSRRGLRAAAVLIGCAAAAGSTWLQLERGVYVTEVGEQRSIILEDGSNVELNARSRIRVRFGEHTRDVDLLEGQALFRVAPDEMRPFTVRTGDTRVRAVGTQFDVYRQNSGTTVSVVEGRVAVDPIALVAPAGDPATTKLLLSAGEQLVVTEKSAVRPSRADIPSATAWTQRQIVFHGSSLGEVVEQFNRYNRKQLVVEDPTLQSVRVSGVFSTTDPTSLLRFLHEQIQLVMTEKNGRIVISRK